MKKFGSLVAGDAPFRSVTKLETLSQDFSSQKGLEGVENIFNLNYTHITIKGNPQLWSARSYRPYRSQTVYSVGKH